MAAVKNANRWLRFEFQSSHDMENRNNIITFCSLNLIIVSSFPFLFLKKEKNCFKNRNENSHKYNFTFISSR